MISSRTGSDPANRLWSLLGWSVVLLVALVVAHDADHVVNEDRQGGLSAGFWVFLPFQYGAIAFVLAMIWRRDRRAPLLAAALGAIALLGFLVAHLMPWGIQPFADYDLPAISWILVFVAMGAALIVLALALRLRLALQGESPAATAAAG